MSFSPVRLFLALSHLNKGMYLHIVLADVNDGWTYGSFIKHTTYSTGVPSKLTSVFVSNFDHDIIRDIIVNNYDISNIIVFLGDTDRYFTFRLAMELIHLRYL